MIGYRSFDRQLLIADSRLVDRPGPKIWFTNGPRQIYITGLFTKVLGEGPALTATSNIPDLDYFCGRGGKDIIPLWRNSEATKPNITEGIFEFLSSSFGFTPVAEDLLAYVYALMATPAYVEHFSEELTIPGPRVPITKDGKLFRKMASLGRRLIWLHTYGERMVPKGQKLGRGPQGKARCIKEVPQDSEQFPEKFGYDELAQTLKVGEGVFEPVPKAVWEFCVSGLDVLGSWLSYRMKKGAGKKSSALNDIRPERWEFTQGLLELLWMLEATVQMFPALEANLNAVLASEVFQGEELPKPSKEERNGPVVERFPPEQEEMGL